MSKLTTAIIALALAVSMIGSANATTKIDRDIVAMLQLYANQMNQSIPYMSDAHTRVDYVSADGKKFMWFATVTTITSGSQVNKSWFDETNRRLMRAKVCNDQYAWYLLAHGVSVDYEFSANNGDYIGHIVITEDDCIN
jgi:hypothetical protein